jgi:hypothetical protein
MISLEEVKRNPEKEDGAASTGIEFFETPEGINLEIPETSYRNDTPSIIVNTKEIELYNFRDANVASDVVAQFDKDRLVLNTWRLGSGEDEYYYIVPGDELRKLYAEFQLQEHQKAELLVGLHNAFAGKGLSGSSTLTYKMSDLPEDIAHAVASLSILDRDQYVTGVGMKIDERHFWMERG